MITVRRACRLATIAIVVGFLIAVALSAMRTTGVRLPSGARLSLSDLTTAHVLRASDGQPATIAFDKEWTLLVFMTAADCVRCLNGTESWSELSDRFADVLDVVGIVVNGDLKEAELYAEAFRPRFDVVWLEDTLTTLGLQEDRLAAYTPLKILLDRTGRPTFASAAREDERTAVDEVEAILLARTSGV